MKNSLPKKMTRERILEQTRIWHQEQDYCEHVISNFPSANLKIYAGRLAVAIDQHSFWIFALEYYAQKESLQTA